MAGYVKNREQSSEIKYLRKVLGQVDKRIQVPESVSADSLRHLLDNVEPVAVREVTSRRPRLSLQSGIAYAAAFALIVALFYSTRLYRPEMISGEMNIEQSAQQPDTSILLAPAEDEDPGVEANDISEEKPVTAAGAETPEPAAIMADNIADSAAVIQPREFGIGGSGTAILLHEQDGYAFYRRDNDENDPDRTSPVSFEVVDVATQEIVAQTDIPLESVSQTFEFDGSIVFVGTDFSGGASIYNYDVSTPEQPLMRSTFAQDGEIVDIKLYKDIVRVVTLSDSSSADYETELLPGCISDEACVITAFDPATQNVVTKQFTGANGTIQLHNTNAYIRYTGHDENGESKDYIAQILFDGMDITLGPVS